MATFLMLTEHEGKTPNYVNVDNVLTLKSLRIPGQNDRVTRLSFIGNGILEVDETVDHIVSETAALQTQF